MPFITDTNIDIYLLESDFFLLILWKIKVTKIKGYKRCLHLDEMCQSFSKLIQA